MGDWSEAKDCMMVGARKGLVHVEGEVGSG